MGVLDRIFGKAKAAAELDMVKLLTDMDNPVAKKQFTKTMEMFHDIYKDKIAELSAAIESRITERNALIAEMAECLSEYVGICAKRNAEPLYGRDARQLGREDGFSFASSDSEFEDAQDKAREVCMKALNAGILKEMPYYLR